MNTKIHDLIIIGAGPCGLTAAIYAVRNKLDTIVLTKDIGGQMAWSGVIENYSGFASMTGPELTDAFENHAKSLGSLVKMEPIVSLEKDGEYFLVKTTKNTYMSIAVLIASGKNPKKLQIPGEVEFTNKGVVYCATCDGPLYANKRVAIIGGGNSALDAAAQLVNIASHVYVINKNSSMKGDLTLFEKVSKCDNITFVYDAMTREIKGDKLVSSIVYERKGRVEEIFVDGVFVQIGLLPNSQFATVAEKNEYGEVLVDSENKTNIPGLFAAGDVTQISEKQVVIAAGEGSKASLSAFKYISRKRSS